MNTATTPVRFFSRGAGRTRRLTGWILRNRRLANGLMFTLALITTAISAIIVEYSERERAFQRQRVVLLELSSSIQQRANSNIAFLRSGAAMMTAVSDMPLPQFRRYVNDLKLDRNFRGALGMGWSVVINRNDAEGYQQSLRQIHRDDRINLWSFDSQSQTKMQHVIKYLEPDTPLNRRALGFDMSSEAKRALAMNRAARSGTAAASGLITLVQDDQSPGRSQLGGLPGFIIYYPVYHQRDDQAQRNVFAGNLRGFVYSPFRVRDFLAEPLRNVEGERYRIVIDDINPDGKTRTQIFSNTKQSVSAQNAAVSEVDIGDRRWRIMVRDTGAGVLTNLALFTIGIGLLITLMLLMILGLVMRSADEAERALAYQEEQTAIRASLSRELNHRVKNTLANVISIATLARRHSTDIGSYVEALTGRIRALSATQDLLIKSEWGDTKVQDLVRAELAPYFSSNYDIIDIDGPDVVLAPNDALGLGLAVHELATNAAKYGALSVPEGKVTIRWAVIDEQMMMFSWAESGGPAVTIPTRRGFGSNLIERAIARDFGSEAKIIFDPAGVRCDMRVPLRKRQPFQLKQQDG